MLILRRFPAHPAVAGTACSPISMACPSILLAAEPGSEPEPSRGAPTTGAPRRSQDDQPPRLDPVHRPVVPELHPDGAGLVPASRRQRTRPAVVRPGEAALGRQRGARPGLRPLGAARDGPRRSVARGHRDPPGLSRARRARPAPERGRDHLARSRSDRPFGQSQDRRVGPGQGSLDPTRGGAQAGARGILPGQPDRRSQARRREGRALRPARGADVSIRRLPR